ncbi:MAG: bifunctional 3,4-dihydroxy-2-butanone-4-phosphate synthase/GTP cyclohydrolase II [Acidiferrobacterales bacterium]
MPISPISDIIEDIRSGRMVIMMDDEDRENEGDLFVAAERVRSEDINFMTRYGRGLVCLTLTPARCEQLQLPLMVRDTHARGATSFTVSIEAAEGVTTGISTADRATTVHAAIRKHAKPTDIVTPGHIFPLRAQRGGVLARAGHTEAGVDLVRLAGLEPACVLCEVMNDDGTMARLPQLEKFAARHGLKIGTIADLIRYRMNHESTIRRMKEADLRTEFGGFRVVAYHDMINEKAHLALVKGEISADRPVLVRVHVHETMLDLFADVHRAGHWTLQDALRRIATEGHGVVVILCYSETSESLLNRIERFDESDGVLELPRKRGHQEELRTYGLGSQILADLGIGKMRVLGHPMKLPAMSGFGLEVVEYIEHGDRRQKGRRSQKAFG